jgi:hypothetical protein
MDVARLWDLIERLPDEETGLIEAAMRSHARVLKALVEAGALESQIPKDWFSAAK